MINLKPLRKKSKEGILYTRRPRTEVLIHECNELSSVELQSRAEISLRSHSDYIPSETLVYFLRETKTDKTDTKFQMLYQIIEERIKQVIFLGGKKSDVRLLNFLESILDDFSLRVIMDREEYEEKLDFFECSFDSTIARRKIDAMRKMYRKDNPNVELGYNEDGEIHDNVEFALQELNPNARNIEDDIYRFELLQAIDTLPEDERRVITLIFAGIPSESTEPDDSTISTILKCSPKTVLNRKKRAVKKLQEILGTEIRDVK